MKNQSLRILVLSPIEPYPPHTGWHVVIYNDIKYSAARGHELTVLALTHEKEASANDLADIATAEYFLIAKPPRWRQVIANFGNHLPYSIVRQHDERLLARASELVRSGKIDVVLIEDVIMGRYAELLKRVARAPVYLRGHNVSTTIARRYYQSQHNPVLRVLGWRQYVKFARYESAVMETFDCVSQISPIDAAQMEKMNPRVRNLVLFSGVDLDYFAFAPPERREPNTIVHVGSLDRTTRLPGMIWFYDQVLPRVRQRFPKARLELAGHTAESRLNRAAPSDVIVHGVVPDVRPYLAKGAVMIVPLIVGSGIRIRILNAMATGNAVVATAVAAEGLPVTHGEDVFITDDEQQFADCVCTLLADSARREAMGRKARATVEARFAWPRIAEELETHLRTAIRQQAVRA